MNKYSDGKDYKVAALCIASYAEDEEVKYIRNFCAHAEKSNCKLVIFSAESTFYYDNKENEGEAAVFDLIMPERFDAIILMAETFKRDKEQYQLVDRALKAGTPVILVNRMRDDCYSITFDYGDAFRDVVKHMIEFHGFRRVNFLAGLKDNSFSEERIRVYREVLKDNGIEVDEERIGYGDFWDIPAKAAVEKFLASGKELPEAIICANDSMALAACSLLKEKGFKIPRDIAVSGFDGVEETEYYTPKITTSSYDYDKMYELVFHMIGEDFKGIGSNNVVRNKVRVGHSCGCPDCDVLDAGDQILNFKSRLNMENKYHTLLNNMTSENSGSGIEDIISCAKEYLDMIDYKDFYVCFNEDSWCKIQDDIGLAPAMKPDRVTNFSPELNILHYEFKEKIEAGQKVTYGDTLPDFGEILESEGYCMVTPFNMREEVWGYFVVTFDKDNFRFSAYCAFCNSFCTMCKNLVIRTDMARVYLLDLITGLYNRNGFYEKVNVIMKRDDCHEFAIISLDMDNLKKINDTYGHNEGDVALAALAGVILEAGEDNGLCARIGGDEFIVALYGDNTYARAEQFADRIREGLKQYNGRAEKPYQLDASIGIFSGDIMTHDLNFFMKHADKAMYAEKLTHKNTRGSSEA